MLIFEAVFYHKTFCNSMYRHPLLIYSTSDAVFFRITVARVNHLIATYTSIICLFSKGTYFATVTLKHCDFLR